MVWFCWCTNSSYRGEHNTEGSFTTKMSKWNFLNPSNVLNLNPDTLHMFTSLLNYFIEKKETAYSALLT